MHRARNFLRLVPFFMIVAMTGWFLLGVGVFAVGAIEDPSGGTLLTGSGFFVGPYTVLTASHVVPNCREIDVASTSFGSRPASVLAISSRADLALLSVANADPHPFLTMTQPDAAARKVVAVGSLGRWHLKPPEENLGKKITPQPMGPEGIRVSPDVLVWSHQWRLRKGFSGSPLVEVRTGHVVGVVVSGYRDGRSWGPEPWTVTSIGADMVADLVRKLDPGVVLPAAGSPRYTDQDVRNAVVRISCRIKNDTDTNVAGR